MKRLWALLGLAVVATVGGYWITAQRHADEVDSLAATPRGSLEWLRVEFGLTDEQFAAIEDKHREYAGVCTRHCADILAARESLQQLRDESAPADAIATAETQLRELEAMCNIATRAHVRAVAALMPPDAGRRYQDLVEPHLASQAHDGSRGLYR